MNEIRYNPYYSTDELSLKLISFEQDLGYEFDILCFWATADGKIYTAHDSGCSCPTPFEDYMGYTQKDVLVLLERVGTIEQATQIFNTWNKCAYRDDTKVSSSELIKLKDFILEHMVG